MPKLLVVETSPRGAASISRNITKTFVAKWKAAHADSAVVQRDLTGTGLEFVTAPWLEAYFTPPDQHTDAMKQALALSDELVAELLNADELVIGTPVYNYNVPALLKAWIDHIVRKGITLGMDGKGLLTGKKATVLIASGGIYSEGSPIADRAIAPQYLKLILGVIGIENVTIVAGGGAKAVDMGEATMDGFIATLDSELTAAAQ
ncbi:FMN-dependent NADH-azoreductase [Jannaschia sp. CCS1]|uniref:FMN-dependent NADH:quinone oxidoreductase 2 n=1 Tax=Jannaschia sp. (strain CCS1) TaxID=290400 RepID=AZOR2_JANSC|nr:NAD(P)H-dependent oxidoreductase [Jannaschia sp. CCS1]Q28QS5.1 RecName: Full=FMN-dependent NADH:quinone oxidoreductase 2; AltName: Full=Azo-dye reductase 2; AltName: Full=FMN-dependent NADH-azo compound oxidoreductase 2; AltName: Full=FMN-dependent NADH-azoreductase 2 [Jannaschia sp. CCS1]ABD54937.1 (Acyl-carrier protein) phosphodiesterase [Jannaschia sp. CCS1]